MLAAAVVAACQLAAQPGAPTFTVNLPGIGPVAMNTYLRLDGKEATLDVTARNDTGKPIRHAEFCVRARKEKSGCMFHFGNSWVWHAGETLPWRLSGPAVGRGLPNHVVDVLGASVVTRFDPVQKLFVERIDGTNGDMSRDQLMALIANAARFQLVGDRAMADAILLGRSETREGGSVSASSEQSVDFGSATATSNALHIHALGGASSQSRTDRIIAETLVLRLTLPDGETIWAWDGTKPCPGGQRARCAIADLATEATR